MKVILNKLLSICLISILVLTQTTFTAFANQNCCPPPGHEQPAYIIPGPQQPCCQQPCVPQSCPCNPCQQNPCCDTCNTCQPCCDPCQTCNTCQCPCGDCPKVEHLCTYKDTPVDLVKICGGEATIAQHAVLETVLSQKVFSKKLHCGDNIAFTLCNGLRTKEGRCLLPRGTQIIACVDCIVPPKKLNKNAKVSLKFQCVMLPNGTTYPICARVFNAEGMLKETKWMSAGKVTAWTIGMFGVGAGLAAACGAGSPDLSRGIFSIGMPVGFGVGLLIGLLGPGLHYKGKCGEKVLIQLTDNLQVCTN